ncbi:MAG: glycosyltransferase family 4 protein [Rhodocyclaceae bacterium]
MGGAQRALIETLQKIVACGYLPIVFVPTPGPFAAALRKMGISCHAWGLVQRWIYFRKPPGHLLRHPYLWSLISLLTLPLRLAMLSAYAKMKQVRLVYSNTITILDGAIVARLLHVPHVWHLHEAIEGNTDLVSPWPTSWLPRFILDRSDRVIVNSEHLRRNLFQDLPQDKIHVVFNGVDVPDPNGGIARPDLPGPPADAPVTAIIGRLDDNKRVIDYLEALALLRNVFPQAHHLIIGKGKPAYEKFLQDAATRLGLSGQIHFLGYRDDIHLLLPRISVLVSASSRESFGRTLIEAMAAGVPVVSTRSGGPDEIVVDGECGFLVDVGDVAALAERMARILGNQLLAQTFGAAGRRRAIERFDLNQTTGEIVRLIEEALSGRE